MTDNKIKKTKLDVGSEKIDNEVGNSKLDSQTSNIQSQNPSSNIQHPISNWSIHQHSWPKFASKFLEEEEISIVVQINGKVRDVLVIQKDIVGNREVVEKMAMMSKKVEKFLEGKTVKKIVYIPGRVVSLVVSPD